MTNNLRILLIESGDGTPMTLAIFAPVFDRDTRTLSEDLVPIPAPPPNLN